MFGFSIIEDYEALETKLSVGRSYLAHKRDLDLVGRGKSPLADIALIIIEKGLQI